VRYRSSPLITGVILQRLESTVATEDNLWQQLCRSFGQMHLDALYMHMLSTCSHGDRKERKHAGKVLGTAVLLNTHSTPVLLATLLQLPLKEVTTLMQSFVDARLFTTEDFSVSVTDTTPLRVCHESLRDFVVDPLRCRVTRYQMSPANSHEVLLDRCLTTLNEHLSQDICDIRNPGLANADVPDLPARIARCVPEAVRYACVSWPVHLVASETVSETISAALLDFCANHLLHWLEVLSLLGELSSVCEHLPRIMEWFQVSLSPANQHYLIKSNRVASHMWPL
jgi:hypothetical protein